MAVFFVLSGYLITTLAAREERQAGRLRIGDFYIRRIYRILPLYYVVLIGYVVVVWFGGDRGETEAFRSAFPYYFFYLSEVPPVVGINNAPFEQSWSLGIEEKFYLIWPLLGFVLLKQASARRCVAAVSVFVILVGLSAVWPNTAAAQLTFPYSFILLGCALASAETAFGDRVEIRGILVRSGSPALIVLIAAIVLLPPEPLWADVALGLIIATTVGCLSVGGSIAHTFLSQPWLTMLGKLSYAFYLVHVVTISLVNSRFPGGDSTQRDVAIALMAFSLSVAIAAVLHVAVERPLIRAGRGRVAARRSKPGTVAVPTT